MLRGLWKLTWLEIRIFIREPLGFIGSLVVPLVVFVGMGRLMNAAGDKAGPEMSAAVGVEVPVLGALLIAITAVLSLVTIISIYREGGILKRLRATPLRPVTILSAHVIVKLLLTAVTLALMGLAGRRFYPVALHVPAVSFALALLVSTFSVLSLGFVIASVVPTARFAQPIGGLVLYPLIGASGLFVPVQKLPAVLQAIARVSPLTYAVSLLKGILLGEGWAAHAGDVAALALLFAVCAAVSSRVFRWE
jgi:ABC-2 type transport system permease protein